MDRAAQGLESRLLQHLQIDNDIAARKLAPAAGTDRLRLLCPIEEESSMLMLSMSVKHSLVWIGWEKGMFVVRQRTECV
jgi:hypothetical protein